MARPFRMKDYLLGVLIGIDQLGNALAYGDPDETISSRIGRIKRRHGGQVPRRYLVARILDRVLDRIDPGHCIDAIERED